ncbi:MAG: glycerol kinase GlpK [Defluviitaleaceae bacterium]|nr:glycerol kinase GlpK [Defluviitaleaceae bacterium]
MSYIMAFDQGTTSSRCIIFDKEGRAVAKSQREFTQIYPQPDWPGRSPREPINPAAWVEHDPAAIWETQYGVGKDAMQKAGLKASDIVALGITNQRETTLVWDRTTGQPIHNAIVWQCRRTAPMCDGLRDSGYESFFTSKTGLRLDAYFSGTKLAWLLENIPEARQKAERGDLLFGTVDTWLIWNLTGGTVHATDHTNASRTLLYNIHTCEWDRDILNLLNIPREMLPAVNPSSGIIAHTSLFGGKIPIAGVAGDQQAALFGQACFRPGQAKNTYGTGCFLLMNTGECPIQSRHGLITTMAASYDGKPQYALEGSVFIGGAVVQWLRDELGLITHAAETEALAASVTDTQSVYIVPAFVGLGAPYWDAHARGAIIGLTRGVNKAHIVRAALESMAYQTNDVVKTMMSDINDINGDVPVPAAIKKLPVDGGACANNFLMQFQADILGVPVERPSVIETTALGAAYLAGLAVGYWESTDDIIANRGVERVFTPQMDREKVRHLVEGWEQAVRRTRT